MSARMQDGTVGNAALTLGYLLGSGHLSITPSGFPYWSIRNAQFDVSFSAPRGGERRVVSSGGGIDLAREGPYEDAHGPGKEFEFRVRAQESLRLALLVRVPDARPFLLFRLSAENTGPDPLFVHDLALLRASPATTGGVRLPDRPRPLDFFQVGWHGWVYTGLRHGSQRAVGTRIAPMVRTILFNPAVPTRGRPGEFWGSQWGILTDQRQALVAGFISTADQFGLLHVDCTAGSAALALISQADGIRLDAGESVQSEWGYLQFVNLPSFDPPADYVDATARQMGARTSADGQRAKWTSWYHHFQNITEEKFLANLDTVDRLRSLFPIETVQLDDGYQAAWGDWEACNDKFPHGLEWLAGEIKQRGYVPGLWLAPFVVDPRSQTALSHPGWMVQGDEGRPIGAGHIWNFDAWALDTTNPEVLDHIEHLADTIAHRWGFSFVKIDWCYAAGLPGKRRDPKATRAQALRRGLEAMRRGLGDEAFLLGCGCPFGPAIGLVDAMRIGPDTAPSWEPLIWNMPWASPFLRTERSLASLRNSIRHTLNLTTLHRRWWWNDPDVVMVRENETRLTEKEVESSVSLIGLHGGLVVNSDDLTRLQPGRLDLTARLIPILSPGGRAVDLLKDEMPEYYELRMEKPWGKWRVLAVFNWSDSSASRSVCLADLGLPANARFHVFDLWHRLHWIQAMPEILLHAIPAHGCRLLRIAEDEPRPLLVGDTLHVTQGAEIERFKEQEGALEIQIGDLERAASGALWLSLPSDPRAATCNDAPVAVRRVGAGIFELPLQFEGKAAIRITF